MDVLSLSNTPNIDVTSPTIAVNPRQTFQRLPVITTNKIRYIICPGLCHYTGGDIIHQKDTITYHYFDYDCKTQGKWSRLPLVLNDIVCLLKDMGKLAKAEEEEKAIMLTRQTRFLKLVELIEEKLSSENQVILVGISHGSLLLHAAILRLQIKLDNLLLLNKLTFYTIGSPRYPQPWLLSKLINFYHEKDTVLRGNLGILKIAHARNPFINKKSNQVMPIDNSSFVSSAVQQRLFTDAPLNPLNPLYNVDTQRKIVMHKGDYLQKISPISPYANNVYHSDTYMLYPLFIDDDQKRLIATLPKRFITNRPPKPYVIDLTDLNKDAINALKAENDKNDLLDALYVRLYFTSPLLGLSTAHMKFDANSEGKKVRDGITDISGVPESKRGGAPKTRIVIKKSGKTYVVRKDKATRKKYITKGTDKTRVFLSDIKGTYKYASAAYPRESPSRRGPTSSGIRSRQTGSSRF